MKKCSLLLLSLLLLYRPPLVKVLLNEGEAIHAENMTTASLRSLLSQMVNPGMFAQSSARASLTTVITYIDN